MPVSLRLSRARSRRLIAASALGLAGAAVAVGPCAVPARAQLTVFDPSTYSQTVLTAARSLQQINNQIKSLQNEATSLINQAKHLTRIDFPELQQLQATLQQIDRLMGQAQGIDFRIGNLDQQFRQLFPPSFNAALGSYAHVADAKTRLDTAMAAFRQTMAVQAQVVGNVQDDAGALAVLVARSQGAEGGLQAAQATNQLLALAAKQQFQIQNLMAAQYRAEAIEQARRVQAESDARAATTRFLGSGSAYTPQ